MKIENIYIIVIIAFIGGSYTLYECTNSLETYIYKTDLSKKEFTINQEKLKQENIDECFNSAHRIYSSNWDDDCARISKINENTYRSCITHNLIAQFNYSNLTQEFVDQVLDGNKNIDGVITAQFEKVKPVCRLNNPELPVKNCSLPSIKSERWEINLKQDRSDCISRYK
jgi:hypothetical protein